MSLREPKYGDVFRWKSDTQDSLVMYIAPTHYDTPTPVIGGTYIRDTWHGVSLDNGESILEPGDVDIRLSLAYSAWSEVPDAS